MTEQLTRFDTVGYLKSPEEMAAYLNACFEQDPGDGSLIRAALNDIARAQGMSQLSRDTGLGRESLYKALGSSGNPQFATVIKVMKALGLKLHASAA
ncbi:addiction module antitoxin [Pseudomonas weihenstephanensis]|uniref:Addiction module antitoxin n=1 Tax=Pseudomonas weihenstephanensis TaxID=1608994 RepID=A0A0J6LGI8_9PSED|nr:addiction module antidote protein [Pseudomonas weihenstephanensis]KMN13471.1 addiction module antitoxin [Pseudomonas weihenstephanensis]GLX90302.1 transcriptional regulator [Pseudomonas fragi]